MTDTNAISVQLDQWPDPNHAVAVLDAVAWAREGLITAAEMVGKIEAITGKKLDTGSPYI